MKPTTARNLAAIATLLGASLVFAAPEPARADQGKWWTPKQGREAGHGRVSRGARASVRHDRGWNRQWRSWRGNRVYRDIYVIRDGRRGPRYRAWRTYVEPDFIYRRRIVRVRPVRYYVSASAVIGGVHLRARFHDDHDDFYYGCNFCDARFGSYGPYRAHLYECDHRPHGYQIVASDWNDRELRDRDWWDDRHWEDGRDD